MVSTWQSVIYGARWLLIAAIVLIVIIWLALIYQYRIVTDVVSESLLEEIRAEAEVVAVLIADRDDFKKLETMALPAQRRITIISKDGTALYDSQGTAVHMDNHNNRPEIIEARKSGTGISRRYSDTLGIDLLYAAKALPSGLVIRIAAPLSIELNLEQRLARPMTISAIIVILCAGAVLAFHLWRDRTRVQELVSVARSFANGQFERRAGLLGHDNMAHLGHELNAMGEQLQKSQQEIAQQRSLLDGALGALTEGIACIDSMDVILYANAAFRHLAASGADVIGSTYYQHIPVQEPEKPQEFEHLRRQLRSLVIPVTNQIRVIVLHDQTERKHMENARRDFISSVSHEFKTPLTSIAGFTETLLDGVLEEDPRTAKDFITRIAKHSDRLAELVKDVLTISRLEQGAWEVRPTACDMTTIAKTIIDEHIELARHHSVTVTLQGEQTLPTVCDEELVRQLLGNLISNAIRYNRPQGTVAVDITKRGQDHCQIIVQDSGIGIPLEHQQHIFERFYRVDSHRSRQSGGTGLGLAIIKQLLDSLGGTISLVSSSTGSAFTVILPLKDPRSEIVRNGPKDA